METVQQSLLVTEEQIIEPTIKVLEEITPKLEHETPSEGISQSLTQSLDTLFPEQQYDEKNLQKAKEILGDIAEEFSDIQLKGIVAEVQFLAESWLDDFERKIFKGMTLKELLHEKGSK